jgi:hypothetical protein
MRLEPPTSATILGKRVAVTSTFIECRSTPPNSTPSGRPKGSVRSADQLASIGPSRTAIPFWKSIWLFYDVPVKKAIGFFIWPDVRQA